MERTNTNRDKRVIHTPDWEEELNECIEQATPHWKGVDADKFLNELRRNAPKT